MLSRLIWFIVGVALIVGAMTLTAHYALASQQDQNVLFICFGKIERDDPNKQFIIYHPEAYSTCEIQRAKSVGKSCVFAT
jgi:hypothetical protein